MPIGILGSLVICTVLYIRSRWSSPAWSTTTTSTSPTRSPSASTRPASSWGSLLVKFGALGGLTSTMIVMLLGQSRVFFSMSQRRPAARDVLQGPSQVPHALDLSSLTVGLVVAVFASTIPLDKLGEMTSIGTLLAFIIVCAGVLVLRRAARSCPPLPRSLSRPSRRSSASSSRSP